MTGPEDGTEERYVKAVTKASVKYLCGKEGHGKYM